MKNWFSRLEQQFQSKRHELESKSTKLTPKQKEMAQEFFGQEQNLKQRDLLIKEAMQRGYYANAKQILKLGDKLWEAPTRLKLLQQSPRLPLFGAKFPNSTSLMDYIATRKVTLLTFQFNQLGENHVKTFIDPFLMEFGNVITLPMDNQSGTIQDLLPADSRKESELVNSEVHSVGNIGETQPSLNSVQQKGNSDAVLQKAIPNDRKPIDKVGLVQINVIEQGVKTPIMRLLGPYLRWKQGDLVSKRILNIYQNLYDKKDQIGITNSALGWVFLCDSHGYLRWHAHGNATKLELETLMKLTLKLAANSHLK